MDYYELLGVSRDCDEKTLKVAFRKSAKKYHPDHNPGCKESEIKFKEIVQAYDILKDPQKRATYDRYGAKAFENGGGYNQNPFHGFSTSHFSDIFEDIFGDFGGGWRKSTNRRERGVDIQYDLTINLEEAYSGKTVEIKIPGQIICKNCKGTGCAKDCTPQTCDTCHGSGQIRTMHGFLAVERICTSCQGRGEVIKNPCKECKGQGQIEAERLLSINIPAGIDDGSRIRLAGEGAAGRFGGSPGDLYVFITIAPHDFFQRDGANLYCCISISMVTAALGGEFIVKTLDSVKTHVKVPESSQTGKQFRIKGKGMPILRQQSKGDLYIEIFVETPQNLNSQQKEILREFAKESEQEQNSPRSFGFFNKMKDFFEQIEKKF